MYDIHHHLLFGTDDGAKDIEMSLAMIQMAADDGITHIAATPHSSHRYLYRPEENAARLQELRQRCDPRITLGMGCDFHLSYENIQDAIANRAKYAINGGQYLLIEFPDVGIPPQISEALYELRLAGLTLIITHPERNPTLRSDEKRLTEWLRAGHLVQITAGVLEGRFGRTAEKAAREMLEKRWVNFVATDAHNTDTRPPKMASTHEIIAREYGKDYADLLCIHNPRAAFDSTELPEQVDMNGIFEEDETEKPKGFLRRLFSSQ